MDAILYEQLSRVIDVQLSEGVVSASVISARQVDWVLWHGALPLNAAERQLAGRYKRMKSIAKKRSVNNYVVSSGAVPEEYVLYRWETAGSVFFSGEAFDTSLIRVGTFRKVRGRLTAHA